MRLLLLLRRDERLQHIHCRSSGLRIPASLLLRAVRRRSLASDFHPCRRVATSHFTPAMHGTTARAKVRRARRLCCPQTSKPREFLWNFQCPLLPKFQVRAASGAHAHAHAHAYACACTFDCTAQRTRCMEKFPSVPSHAHSVKRASRAQVWRT